MSFLYIWAWGTGQGRKASGEEGPALQGAGARVAQLLPD